MIDLAAAGLDAATGHPQRGLSESSQRPSANLALETLRKLLTDQIKISERTNLVQAQKFREALEKGFFIVILTTV